MNHWGLVVLAGILVIWHLLMTGYVYADALKHGMNQRRWALVSFLVPLFGFFAYMFERDDRTRDEEADPFAEGPYRIHQSRIDDAGPELADDETDREDEPSSED